MKRRSFLLTLVPALVGPVSASESQTVPPSGSDAPRPRVFSATALPSGPDDLPFTGPRNRPDIFEIDCVSRDAILRTVPGTHAAQPWVPDQMSFGRDGRIDYIRFGPFSQSLHPRLINWIYPLPRGSRDVYTGYLLWIEDGVWDAMQEQAIKLSGARATNPKNPAYQGPFMITEHSGAYYGKKDPRERNVFGLRTYFRDMHTGSGNPTASGYFAVLHAQRWYWIEEHLTINTPGEADGVAQIWVNGHLVLDETHEWWTDREGGTDATWSDYQVQVYHGGTKHWLGANAFYRYAKMAASTHYIGVPEEVR